MPDESTTPDLAACVLHTGRIASNGYGQVGRHDWAHRAAWEAAHGPIPAGLELHHVCENPACVNVDHLLPLTHKQHFALHRRAHCIHGHPFDAENTYVRPDNGKRQCRACGRGRQARYKKARTGDPSPVCVGCAETLREAPDGLCGWCAKEMAAA